MINRSTSLSIQAEQYLERIYKNTNQNIALDSLCQQLLQVMKLNAEIISPEPATNNWTAEDIVLITYGDSIVPEHDTPLKGLKRFLDRYCDNIINSVHILPFFPFSSDDGFSVIDYQQVDPEIGNWSDIAEISHSYRLMADLVINHCSIKSLWFQNFIAGKGEGSDFFQTASEDDDLRMVVRPRTSPLLRSTRVASGQKLVWCTFSHDQVDLDFKNPEVLLTFCKIIRFYLDKGVRLFRLDAVAFLWKEAGTSCINLPQTHMVVRLLRLLIEHAQNDAVVITETNIPVRENLSYFGDTDEANWVYNFPLPPLLLHTLLNGDSTHLKSWLMSMPPALDGTAYFNFLASHDGIGLRPIEGILTDDEIDKLATTIQSFGGKISWRTISEQVKKPYELNVSLFDAMQGDINGKDNFGEARFLCAHTIMFGLEGIPGLYIHSLLATSNDYQKLKETGENRSINRHKWLEADLLAQLETPSSQHSKIYKKIKFLLDIRTRQLAFHPNATQFTLQLRNEMIGYWRQSLDRRQSIFAISNITKKQQELTLSTINLIDNQPWYDLLSGEEINTTVPILHFEPYQSRWITNRVIE